MALTLNHHTNQKEATPMTDTNNPTSARRLLPARIRAAAAATRARMTVAVTADDGMSTVEYAIGTIAAAAFGAILYTVVTGDSVVGALTRLIGRALETQL